ncbi:unnamed protein product [Didymodactylos carnosus]|uniref:Uncharacterized protein n=1 Tax=Didymodactylos carnosus TaxID=1234261 RepID=A0A8S2NRH8_9BILA|nr:unnamed protein product [Didymodactylos carnosus]CAF4008966.1 unnamed protein product [Didymodactylos carnosus]
MMNESLPSNEEQPKLRTNIRYDEITEYVSTTDPTTIQTAREIQIFKDNKKGINGRCTITATVNGSHLFAEEIANNVDQMRVINLNLVQNKLHPNIRQIMLHLTDLSSSLKQNKSLADQTIKTIAEKAVKPNLKVDGSIRNTFHANGEVPISYFSSVYINDIRFTTKSSKGPQNITDSCILFKCGQDVRAATITDIFQLRGKTYLRVLPLRVTTKTGVPVDDKILNISNLFIGKVSSGDFMYLIPDHIIEKLVYYYEKDSKLDVFFRFPTLIEST